MLDREIIMTDKPTSKKKESKEKKKKKSPTAGIPLEVLNTIPKIIPEIAQSITTLDTTNIITAATSMYSQLKEQNLPDDLVMTLTQTHIKTIYYTTIIADIINKLFTSITQQVESAMKQAKQAQQTSTTGESV